MTRETAIEILKELWRTKYPLYLESDIRKALEMAIQTLEQEPKWIPVSERLPEINEWVICQCRANIYEVLKFTSYGWYHDDAHCYMDGFVIAWMPLPPCYEPQKGANE